MDKLEPCSVALKNTEARQHLFGDFPRTKRIRSGKVILKPGESVGEHNTKNKEELIIIIDGTAEIFSDKKTLFVADKNTVVYIPPDTIHNIKNTCDKPLKYIYVVAPID